MGKKQKKIICALAAVGLTAVFFAAGFGIGRTTGAGADPYTAEIRYAEETAQTVADGVLLSAVAIAPEEYAEHGVEAAAETAYQITATATRPDGSECPDVMQGFLFTLDWQSATSDSVSSFATIINSERTATVSILKGFNTPIVLRAQNRYNPTKTGELTIDYAKRIAAYRFGRTTSQQEHVPSGDNLTYVTLENGREYEIHFMDLNTHGKLPSESGSWANYVLSVAPEHLVHTTLGTVDDTVKFNYTIRYTDEFWKKVEDLAYTGKRPVRQDYVKEGAASIMKNQYELLGAGADDNMKQYIGESVTSGAYHGMSTYVSAFMDLLKTSTKVFEVEIRAIPAHSLEKTFKIYLTPTFS